MTNLLLTNTAKASIVDEILVNKMAQLYVEGEHAKNCDRLQADYEIYLQGMFRYIQNWSTYNRSFNGETPEFSAWYKEKLAQDKPCFDIYTGGLAHPWLTMTYNWRSRCVHDWFHYRLKADFSIKGELEVYKAQRTLAPRHLEPVLFSEIILQACFFHAYGAFPTPQKVVLLDWYDIEQFCSNYRGV